MGSRPKEQPTVSSHGLSEQGGAAKPSRIPDYKIAFIQLSFAASADESLDERLRLLLAHAATKPHLTLEELAPFAGVRTGERINQLLNTGVQLLWQNDPPELQQRYPLELLRRHRSKGVAFSAEHRAKAIEARRGKPLTSKQLAHLSGLHESRKGKPHSSETRTRMREAQQKRREHEKQQQAEQVIFDAKSPIMENGRR